MQGRTFTESLFSIRYQAPAPLIDMHPLWSARAGSSFDRRRDPSLLFQYLPGRLMHHHFRLLELEDTADPNAETRRHVNTGNSAPYSLQQILQVW